MDTGILNSRPSFPTTFSEPVQPMLLLATKAHISSAVLEDVVDVGIVEEIETVLDVVVTRMPASVLESTNRVTENSPVSYFWKQFPSS